MYYLTCALNIAVLVLVRGSLEKHLILALGAPLLRPDTDDFGIFEAAVDDLRSPVAGLGMERRFVGTIAGLLVTVGS